MNLILILLSFLSLSGRPGATSTQNPSEVTTEKICIVGQVVKPSDLDFKRGLTVSEAISAAGGILPGSKSLKVIVISQPPGKQGEFTATYVDLKAIHKKRKPDLKLEPFSVVEVLTRKAASPSEEFINLCPWFPVLKNRM